MSLLDLTGRREEIEVQQFSAYTASADCTELERGTPRIEYVQAIVTKPDSTSENVGRGGERSRSKYQFIVEYNTIEFPHELARRPVHVIYEGATFKVLEVRSWRTSHERLIATQLDRR